MRGVGVQIPSPTPIYLRKRRKARARIGLRGLSLPIFPQGVTRASPGVPPRRRPALWRSSRTTLSVMVDPGPRAPRGLCPTASFYRSERGYLVVSLISFLLTPSQPLGCLSGDDWHCRRADRAGVRGWRRPGSAIHKALAQPRETARPVGATSIPGGVPCRRTRGDWSLTRRDYPSAPEVGGLRNTSPSGLIDARRTWRDCSCGCRHPHLVLPGPPWGCVMAGQTAQRGSHVTPKRPRDVNGLGPTTCKARRR